MKDLSDRQPLTKPVTHLLSPLLNLGLGCVPSLQTSSLFFCANIQNTVIYPAETLTEDLFLSSGYEICIFVECKTALSKPVVVRDTSECTLLTVSVSYLTNLNDRLEMQGSSPCSKLISNLSLVLLHMGFGKVLQTIKLIKTAFIQLLKLQD